jgi:hypothetical protein
MSRNAKETPPTDASVEMDADLRGAYRALPDGQPILSDLPMRIRKTVRKRRVRRLAAVGGTAAILIPAVLVIALVGSPDSRDDRQIVISTPGPTASSTTPAATETPASNVTKSPSPAEPPPSPVGSPVTTGPQNLTVTSAVRQELIDSYETTRQLGSDAVTGTRPNSVYYAFDPRTGIHWAVANFNPSATLSEQQSVSFQDGGSIGVFRQAPHAAWQLLGGGGAPPDCTGYLPAAVRSVWNWPSGASCGIVN